MKTVAIVIDGMDYQLTERYLGEMPFIKSISEQGYFNILRSVTPPDSIPAWNTIYTGLTPGEHGVFDLIDYLDILKGDFRTNADAIRGRSFWDVLTKAGKSVCVVNPFMAYPSWEVNGIMVSGPVFESGDISVYPPDQQHLAEGCPSLGGIVAYPTKRTLQSFIDDTIDLTRKQFAYFRKLSAKAQADFNFFGILTLDRLEHFLWRFTDKGDPTYPGDNEFYNVIKDFYLMLDKELQLTIEGFPSDTQLIILSDHGHGRRCTKLFRVNEFLRRLGYVHAAKPSLFNKSYLLEKAKDISLQLAFKLSLEDYLLLVGRMLPGKKSIKTAKHAVKNDTSLTNVPKFDGMNPFGGICINKAVCGERYETVVQEIIDHLLQFSVPGTGEKIVRWAKTRAELYPGSHQEVFPDIIFGLDETYGIDWTLFVDLIADNPFHRRQSGGHRPEGVLATNIKQGHYPSSVVEIHDCIVNTVLK
jgi:predicted AlkP superfamily phosphohydrolase/phosphomutase